MNSLTSIKVTIPNIIRDFVIKTSINVSFFIYPTNYGSIGINDAAVPTAKEALSIVDIAVGVVASTVR